MATTSKKSTPYKSTSISSLTKPKTQSKVTPIKMPSIPAGPTSKNPTVKMPVIPAGPKSTPQSKVPTIVMPTFAPGPQSKVTTPYKSTAIQALTTNNKTKSSSPSKTTSKSSPTLEGTDNYTPMSIQSLTSGTSARTSSSSSGSSGGSSSTSSPSNVAGGGASGSAANGSSGDSTDNSPSAQLDRMNAEALRLQKMVDDLAAKDKTAATDAVVTDSDAVKAEKDAAAKLKKMMEPKDDGLDLLDAEIARNEQLLQQEMSSIQAAYDVQKTDTQGKQLSETGQTSMGIANAGGYLGFSGSGTGVMLKLAESHRAELTSLESQRQNAIVEANNAAAERRYDMVQTKVDEIARIDQEKYERTQEYYARVKENAEVEKVKAERKQTENSIYTAIQAGAKSAEDIFRLLDGKVAAEDINKFLKDIVPDSIKDVGAGFKFSASNNATLLGAGLGSDDIQALNEYVNENGYDDTVRSNLTPLQRAAADKIFRPVSGSTTGFGKPMGVLDLDRIEESYGVRFPFGTTQAEATQFFADNPGATPEEMQAALDQSVGGGASSGQMINFDTTYLKNLDIDKQKALADLVGASAWWTGKETDIKRMFDNPDFITNLNEKIDGLRSQGIADSEIIDALTS